MLHQTSDSVVVAANHPQAKRMAVTAGLSHNIVVGCLFGSFGVMMTSVEQRLGISRELSAMGVSIVSICNAVVSPIVGMLAARYSLRALFTVGAIISALGYAVLATTHSFALYLLAYGLLLGPGMAFSGVVLPSTLVTRWFNAGRGRVLGLVHMPIFIGMVPVLTSILLMRVGAPATYTVFAVLIAVTLVPLSLTVIEQPPGSLRDAVSHDAPVQTASSASAWQIISSLRFWAFSVPAAVIITSVVVVNTHMIPLVANWGISTTAGATLLSVFALSGIPGSIMWGWIADKLGAGLAMSVCALGTLVLWSLLLTSPPYPLALLLMCLMGMHATASIPLMGMSMSEAFGSSSFSRAYGLATMMTLPFTVVGIQASSAMYVKTGGYTAVIITMMVALLVIAPIPYLARRRKTSVSA